MKQQIKQLTGRDVYVREFENIKKSDRVNSARRASYVERNQWMIDESDRVVVCLDNKRKKGGTRMAYEHALKKLKIMVIINEI